MWKILGLVFLCGLLSYSEGKAFANRAVWSQTGSATLVTSGFMNDGVLLNQLKGIGLSDVDLGGHLGLVNSITGLKIVKLDVTAHEIVLIPEITGAGYSLSLRLSIGGRTLVDITKISISLDVKFHIKYNIGNFQNNSIDMVIHECDVAFGEFETTILGSTLLPPQVVRIKNFIGRIKNSVLADINRQVCGILNVASDLMIKFMTNTVNVALPVGPFATLRCSLGILPTVTPTLAIVDIFIDVEVPGGGIFSIPDSATNIDLPPMGNFKHCQAFHPELFNLLLPVLAPKPTELHCTQDQFSGADNLKNAILALVPSENHDFVAVNPLSIKLSFEVNPVVVFGTDGAIISATTRIEIFIKNADGSIYSVIILRSRLIMRAAISLVKRKLIFKVSLSDLVLELISSGAGISDVSTLEPHCGNLVTETTMAKFNENLSVGIPVLSVFGTELINPTLQFNGGALVGCI